MGSELKSMDRFVSLNSSMSREGTDPFSLGGWGKPLGAAYLGEVVVSVPGGAVRFGEIANVDCWLLRSYSVNVLSVRYAESTDHSYLIWTPTITTEWPVGRTVYSG